MHERRHHRDIMETWQKCYVCGASFGSGEELQKHLLCHPGALSLNLQPGGLGFPQLPMNFSLLHDAAAAETKTEPNKSEPSFDLKEFNKAFHAYTNPPRSAPVTASFSDAFSLPPFASSAAHALIQRSLSQGSTPSSAVSMLLASNGADGMNLFNHAYTASALLSPTHLHPPGLMRPDPPMTQPQPQQQTEPEQTQKKDEVAEVSTTTRSRKYSSDSHTSLSLPDAQSDNNNSQLDLSKQDESEQPNQSHKSPSEDSSLNESRSEDFQSDETHSNTGTGISRRNLNKKLISSRKQRHPTRRLSTSGSLHSFGSKGVADSGDGDQDRVNLDQEACWEGLEEAEKMSRDQTLVTFLLNRGDVYKCEHCHIIFEDCTLYLVHNGFHANDTDPFKCVICKKVCDGRIEFNLHLTSHIK